MISVIQGLPGSGKSAKMARMLIATCYRNKRWYEKQLVEWDAKGRIGSEPRRRMVYHNLLLSAEILDRFSDFLMPWDSPDQLPSLRNVDVFWDEIGTHIDATQWANMSLELKRWLQQHRKFGIEIVGTCQDFAQVDVSFRRLTEELVNLRKLCGSRDISPTKPPPKYIWGIIIQQALSPQGYNDVSRAFKSAGFPWPMWLSRDDVEVYDTTAEVPVGQYPPLRHVERRCSRPGCDHVKIIHS